MWELHNERRAAPRREVKLDFRVLLIATKTSAEGEEQMLPLIGYTRNVSESGLALMVSAKNMSVLYSLGYNYTLQLVLTLPSGSVEMEVSPVRYQHIKEGGGASFILIGSQITKMSDQDRTRFVEYLRSFQ
jgi:PilZ domain